MPVKKLSDLPQKISSDNGDGFVITSVTGQDMRVPFQNLRENLGVDALEDKASLSSVSSISDLKGFNVSPIKNGDTVNVLGYYSNGDGGGGKYYWDSTSEEAENEGAIIQVTGVSTGRFKLLHKGIIWAKQFGIKTDGTEQSAEIADAINSIQDGITFKFNPETYTIAGEITVTNKSNITIDAKGAIFDASAWTNAGGGTEFIFNINGSVTEEITVTAISENEITVNTYTSDIKKGDWIRIESDEIVDASFIGVRDTYTKDHIVKVDSVTPTTITINTKTPILWEYTTLPTIEVIKWSKNIKLIGLDIVLYDEADDARSIGGIALRRTKSALVEKCEVTASSIFGLMINQSVLATAKNNDFKIAFNHSISRYGLYCAYSSHVNIIDNNIDSQNAIDGRISYYVKVNGNNCNGEIRPHGSLYWDITDNSYKGSSLFMRCGKSKVEDNTIYSTNTTGRGLALAEMATLFGDVTIKNNIIIDLHEIDGTETDYAISLEGKDMKNIFIEGNIIKGFANGIYTEGTGDAGRTANNIKIKRNILEVFNTGISHNRIPDSIVHDNEINLTTHASFTSGRQAIVMSASDTDPISGVKVTENNIDGAFDTGLNISTENYNGIIVDGNIFGDEVTKKISSDSTFGFIRSKMVNNLHSEGGVHRASYFINDNHTATEKIRITFKGAASIVAEMIKVKVLGVRANSGTATNKYYIEKQFFICALETGFRTNNHIDIMNETAVVGELTATHSGADYTYYIDMAFPAGFSASEVTQTTVMLEVISPRVPPYYPELEETIIIGEPELVAV